MPNLTARVIDTAPHGAKWFTQGIYQEQNQQQTIFYISSGLYGQSLLIRQGPRRQQVRSLPGHYFAEGLTVIGNRIFLLTWKAETLLVFDKHTLAPLAQFSYQGEGWGLTHNKEHLIMSNGSSQLQFRDPGNFRLHKSLEVQGLNRLNELEYAQGVIWANRWYDDAIYAIDASNGCILAKLDLTALRQRAVTPNYQNIANGIAYDPTRNGLWVTGKYWPVRFLIEYPLLTREHCTP